MQRKLIALIAALLLVAAAIAVWQAGWDLAQLEAFIQEHSVSGALVCVGVFIVSTVLPISALPLLPLAARSYGVWITVLLSTSGWWLGSLAAFMIARSGRRHLERFISLTALSRFENRISAKTGFGEMVVLRVVFPGDLVAFAFGILEGTRFSTFAIASLIGTIPGAILLSYAGGELGHGNFTSFGLIVVAMALTAILLRRLWPGKTRAVAQEHQ